MKKIYSFLLLSLFAFSAKSQTDFPIGSNTGTNTGTTFPAPLQDWYEGSRAQYLYLASELQAAGMGAGFITSIKYDIQSLNTFSGTIEQLSISIGSTATASLDPATWETGTIQVMAPIDFTPTLGINEIIFSAPFFWNGTDNIIIETCNGDPNTNSAVFYTNNPSFPWTTGLSFNGSHTYRADNEDNLCGTSNLTNSGTLTTRPDVIFTWNTPTSCTGIPTAGLTASNKDTICPNKAFNLFTQGSTLGSGLTYQWQDSIPGVSSSFTDIGGATGFSYSPSSGITVSKYFRRKITCSGNTRISTPRFILVRPFYECYCSPIINTSLHTSSTTTTIESVAIVGGIINYSNSHPGSNSAPTLGYANFTDTTGVFYSKIPRLNQAVSYNMTVTTSSAPANNAAGYWIDWNHNGTYDPAEYVNIPFKGATSADISIDVPANAILGLTMLRIRTSSFGFTNASGCASFGNGETEDYLFRVLPGVSCTGSPIGGQAASSVASICPTIPFDLSVTNATDGVTNLQYQWQDSSAQHNWQDIATATNKIFTVSGITIPTWYRRKITCTSSNQFSYSATTNVTLNPLFDCYCSPLNGVTLHTFTGPNIENIAINGGTVSYTNSHPGANVAPSLGYVAFTDTSTAPQLAQETNYTLTVTTSAKPNQAAVWIDYNHSGTLDPSEYQLITFATGATTADVVINPPATALLGFTMMRIRVRGGTFTLACEQFASGETEDYIIKILPGSSCTGKPIGGTTDATIAVACDGVPVSLSVTGATEGVINLTYQWQDSIPGTSTKFNNIIGADLKTLTTTQSFAKYYRRKIKCTSSIDSSYSSPVFVDQLAVTYTTVPYTEDFENTWIDGCGDANSRTIPTNNWRNYPLTGNNSWRRDDDAISASWVNPTLGTYTPASSTGNNSARFHSYQAASGTSGNFDLFLDCTGGSSLKQINFDYINTNGVDSLEIFASTNGGNSYSKIGVFKTATAWTPVSALLNSTSATTVVRFKATSDFGTTDIGIDNISIIRVNAIELEATAVVAPAASFDVTTNGIIILTVKNTGAAPVNFSVNNDTIGAWVTNPNLVKQKYQRIISSGILLAGASRNDTIATNANFGIIGNYSIKAGLHIGGDPIASNDSTNVSSHSATPIVFRAIANGNWGDASTWSTNSVPTSSDSANITGFNVTLGGTPPFVCGSLGIGNNGKLSVGTGVLSIGGIGVNDKAFTLSKGATLNISGGTLNHNGFILFGDSSNFEMSAGSLNIDGNSGTDIGSVTSSNDLLGFGTVTKPYSFGNINLTGGTITIVDPHRFNGGVSLGYRGSASKNISTGNTIILGNGLSNQTASTNTSGFQISLASGGGRLSLGNLTVNGGNVVAGRHSTSASNLGINGDLTINASSEFRSTITLFVSGNIVNNGILASSSPINLQTYLAGVAGAVSSGQNISGSGIYRNTTPATTLVAAGTGYSVGDILTLSGGVNTTPATIYVLSVGGTGNITGSVLFNMGSYSTAPAGVQTATGGSGNGATFTNTGLVTIAKFAGLVVNNSSTSGVNISSLGTSLPTQTTTIAGNAIFNLINGIVNNGSNIITLGNSPTQRGLLVYNAGMITGKFRRWFNAATNTGTSGDLPVGNGTFAKPIRVEFTTAPTKGGTLTAEYIATAPGQGGFPINDGISLVTINNAGYWRLETDSVNGGNYTVSLSDSGVVNAQNIATLRSVKRAIGSTNWSVEGSAGTNTGTNVKPVVVRTGLSSLGEYAIAGADDNILPLSNVKFTGEKSRNVNNLKWVVTNELDIKGYELQRSSNGNNFEAIGFVNSKATNNQTSNFNYSFVDNNSISNDAYYRLKQVAKDGSFDHSNVVLIKGQKVSGLIVGNVYPNPVKDLLTVTIASSSSKSVNISITDLLGKTVVNTTATLIDGDNNIQIKLSKLSVGSYTITVMDATGKKSNNVTFIKE